MTIKQNKALVLRIYDEMWNQHDPMAARQIFAQPDGVERFVSEFLQAFPDLQHTVEELIGEGDMVVARFSARGTHLGRWKQYAASGKPIQYTGVTIVTIENNKIIHHRTWWDMLEVIEVIKALSEGDPPCGYGIES